MKQVYFDNAATTPIRPQVIDCITQSLQEHYANCSSTYGIGRAAKAKLEYARKNIAKLLGVAAAEVVFTSGGTEANNLILQSLVKDVKVTHIVSSKIEHHAVLKTIDSLQAQYPIQVSYVDILPNGQVDIHHLEEILQHNTHQNTAVSLMHINNEIGTILNIEQVARLCKTYSAYFHSDTVQSIGNTPIDFSLIDFFTASAHKFHGPKGVGFAVIKKNTNLKSILQGGEQERGLRPGTEALHQIEGMAKALEIAYENMEVEQNYIKEVKLYFVERIHAQLPEISFNGGSHTLEDHKASIINLCLPIPSSKANTTLFQLDMQGVFCSRGSACQSGSNQPSHVLAAFLSKEKLDKTSLRFSLSIFNTKDDIDYLVLKLKDLLGE